MQQIFINHTNHPSDLWSEAELEAASKYGKVRDFPFPNIEPAWDEEQVRKIAEENGKRILALRPSAVLCQGEFTYCFALITFLKEQGVTVLSACSNRESQMWTKGEDNVKISKFVFVRFRKY